MTRAKAAIALLEHLAISPPVCLTIGLDRLVPGPHVFDKSLILRLLEVELCELVAIIVWCNIKSWQGFLSTDEESTSDDRVIGLAVYGRSAEDVLTAGLKTVEETTYEKSKSTM